MHSLESNEKHGSKENNSMKLANMKGRSYGKMSIETAVDFDFLN